MNMKEMKTENGTEKKEDRRVRRTKKLLSQGLIELMQHKQVKDITVRELAERVDVNRGTFYLYYRDIFDLLERLEEDLFEQLNEVIVAALPNCNPDAVTLEAQIVPDVCADSLDTVELSMAIEDKLGVSMPDGLMATMLTIGDLLKYLQENK